MAEAIPRREYKLDQSHDLQALLEECVRRYQGIAQSRGITVELAMHSQRPLRFAFDWESLRLVLSNLLDNAVKYSYSDTYVRVLAERRDQDVVISVENMGTGIHEDELDAIFQRFYRARVRDPKRLIWGTGLGLAVAKEVVDTHQGQIWAASVPGGRDVQDPDSLDGYKTTFHLRLPLSRRG